MPNEGPRLTSHIVKIVYRGFTFEGDSTSEIMVAMNESKLFTYHQIAYVFGLEAGSLYKRMRVWKNKNPERLLLIKESARWDKEFLQLYLEEGYSLFQIAKVLQCSMSIVFRAKDRLLPNKDNKQVVLLFKRHDQLCKILFGYHLKPDHNFVSFIMKQFDNHLSKDVSDDIIKYYIEGTINEESVDKAIALRQFSNAIRKKFTTKNLIYWGVVCLER